MKQERDIAEANNEALQAKILVGQQAQFSLNEQKVLNLALKETIDRLRHDLDGIRSTSPSPGSFGSSRGSALLKDGTAKKPLATLDVELSQSMRYGEDGDDTEATTAVATPANGETVVHEDNASEEPIITARRRKRVSDACNRQVVVVLIRVCVRAS